MTTTTPDESPVIGIVGAGLIGASWAACFAAHGFSVRAWDPADDAEERLYKFLSHSMDTVPGALPIDQHGTVSFHQRMTEMVAGCDLIMENAPEREDVKIGLLAELDDLCSTDTIIASSTSSLLLSRIASDCDNKERVIIAHPFNPPHLLPLVELFGTAPDIVARASTLFQSCGKRPVILKKELIGHIANRLTSALFREALYMLEQGVASAEDIDACISEGPGLRWALMGPFMSYHLGGGEGGIDHYMKHLGPSQVKRWADHGTPEMTDDFVEQIISEVKAATHGDSVADISERRDQMLQALLGMKASAKPSH
ncbi:MAG: 3-hydroxyacyl-CoA dehydrogenase [Rhodospirillales bacterium]|jgi:carnitine 3-dehydrogenase|nr:3-hydroxyacyl-CoA dehydrogenase [Rhodospirillales bacterium]MBT4038450.1 3-hydroxyacyl-CoA dehydrogenase [Rhodospirillales bacterium]MBT4627376.1 3-hydroxyacyl-CoA dehydrogenase [Rhodospirillales bacterium]MBT5350918.1 3-hydroxyacyl-CoA dehydrogenase [Rhodospirillales bacterium]MBT5519595.1 3-hydroxyacyl-CoA dehydrogenase [Rhodospirillales bacterium]